MSALNRFCAKAKQAAEVVTDKAEQVFDSVSKSVKIKSLEFRIDQKYEDLGRLVYRDLHTDENLEEEKLEIIAAIDALFDEISLLKEEEEQAEEEADLGDEAPEEQ